MATRSTEKPKDKCRHYKPNKNPDFIAPGVSVNRPPMNIYCDYQCGTDAPETVNGLTRRHQTILPEPP
jgi:hypothetical protein